MSWTLPTMGAQQRARPALHSPPTCAACAPSGCLTNHEEHLAALDRGDPSAPAFRVGDFARVFARRTRRRGGDELPPILTPLREQLSEQSGGTYDAASARVEGSPAAGAKTGTATGPRVLGFEQILASDYNEDKFPAPGEWYVSLNAADTATFPAEVPAELPVELQVEVIGQAQPSSADFAKALHGPRKQQPTSPDSASGPERLLATVDQPADPALTLALVAVIALLGGLALGTLAIVVLGLGRRRT
jgi:hypothetical protein